MNDGFEVGRGRRLVLKLEVLGRCWVMMLMEVEMALAERVMVVGACAEGGACV